MISILIFLVGTGRKKIGKIYSYFIMCAMKKK